MQDSVVLHKKGIVDIPYINNAGYAVIALWLLSRKKVSTYENYTLSDIFSYVFLLRLFATDGVVSSS